MAEFDDVSFRSTPEPDSPGPFRPLPSGPPLAAPSQGLCIMSLSDCGDFGRRTPLNPSRRRRTAKQPRPPAEPGDAIDLPP
jgi:hypothetical protein